VGGGLEQNKKMTKRISESEAIQIMHGGGLEPLVPYKSNSTPWLSKCLLCGSEVSPSLKSISNRSLERKGCRYCAPNARKSNKQASEVMRKANLEPLEPYVNSNTKWKCKCLVCDSIVFPRYNSINSGQGGCLNCAGMLVNPEEAKAFFIKNNLEPLVPYPGAGNPWKSRHSQCGKEVEPTYSNVRSGHSGCKYCVGNIVDEDKARKIFIARGLLPIEPYRNALATWKSIHQECGQVVNPRFNGVQQGQGGCPSCAGNKQIDAGEAVGLFKSKGLEPLEAYPGSQLRWKSKHSNCGRIVFPRYASVKQGSSGCGYCSGNVIDPDDAVKLFKKSGLDPIEEFVNSSTPWRSVHVKCGREVSPAYNSVQQGSSGCGHCAGNIVDEEEAKNLFISRGLIPQGNFPGSNKPWRSIHAQCGREVFIKYAYVLDVFRSANLEPLEPYPGANRGWKSIHTVCGKEVTPHWGYVRKYLAGCKYCAGKAMTEADAIEILRSKGFEAKVPFPGTQVPWLMVHRKCGMTVSPRLNSLQFSAGGGSGCRKCADSTFNYSEPAIIYLITNVALGAHKLGISGETKNRLQQHRREGWETFKTLKIESGENAYKIEQEILEWMGEVFGWTPYLTKSEMPQGGYTETVDASEIDLPIIWAKVEELSKVKR
jgi:recombinational DNA repair protein (RecF pathway)